MRTIIRKRKIALGASLLVILVLFSEWTALELTKPICPDFSYQADIFSIDNFYNEEEARFYGELVSNSKFSFQVIEKKEEGFVIENSFGVTKPDGSEIFSVKRLLGSDPEGNHVSSLGDKVRVGRIFGPEKGEDEYTYWHINYDVPIQLKKVAREYIFGLAVEKYEGVIEADQTENLSYLPGVPEKRGVRVKGLLSTWIEPRTGRLIKYEDFARAWYYDVLSGENTIPWNEFHNEFQNTSVIAQVQKAQAQILLIRICQVFFPVFLLLIFTLWYFKVSSFWRQRILSSQGFFIAALIFVFGLLVTSYSFYALDKSHLREQVENTEYFSRELVNALQREIQVASEALEFMRYQFQQNDTITESQFNVQAQRLINRSTSIKGLSWLPRINNQDRKAFEKLIPSGYISAWDGSTNNKLAPVAPFYFPVYYIVPNEGNSKAIGFDVNTRPETKACIKNALLFNGIQTSAPVLIVQEKDTTQRSIILTNPILSDEKECVGLINCIIRLPDLANTAYSRLNNPKDLSFSIHDKDQGKRIFFSDGAFEEKKAGFVVSKSLPVLGRLWNIEVMRPKYGLPWNAILILGFGFLVFSLSSILVYRLLNDKSKILLETNLALEINSKQLLEKNKELEQFIHISSHDLREPVNTLGSFLELLEEENQDKLDSDSKTYLHYAKNQQQRMESIVRSLGDYIRIGRAQEKTLTDMQSLVEAAIAKNQKVIKAIDAKIQVNSLPSLAIFRHEMESVWNNLISNALKFHKNNSHCFIEIGHQDLPGEHLFFIKDNGIGIEPQYYDRIFEIFKRLNLRDEFSGNGMGLSICRKAIEHHGGKIWVESESGKGAAFFFKLPKA